jgi:PAS domain S-box-containing protein
VKGNRLMDGHNFKNREGIAPKTKRVELDLLESELKYQTLVNNSLQGLMIAQGIPPRLVFVNSAMADIMGYTVEEMLALSPEEARALVHPEDQSMFFENYQNRLEGKTAPLQYEVRAVRKDKSVLYMEIFSSRIEYKGETAVQAAFIDITERKHVEEELRESEEKLRVVFEHIGDGVIVSDLEGRITDENEAALRMQGFKHKKEVIGKNGYDFIAEKDRARALEDGVKTVELGRGPGGQYTFLRKDGSEYEGEAIASLLRDSSGNPVGFVSVTRDITERKQAEEVLRESEVRYRLLAENVTDIIWTMDMNLKFTYFSPSITRLGYSAEEAVALSLDRIVTPDSLSIVQKVFMEEMAVEELDVKRKEGAISSQDVLNLLSPDQREAVSDITIDEWLTQRKVLGSKYRMRILEIELCCKDGTTIWVELAASFVRDSDGKPTGIVGMARDISDRKKVEEEKIRVVTEKAAVLDSMGEGLLIVGMDGKVISCNPAFQKLCCYAEDDLIGRDAFDLLNVLVKAEDQQRLMTNFATALEADIAGTEYFTLVTRDGREIPVATTETKIVDKEGNPPTIIATFKDVTDIRQAETALRENEEKLRCFMDSAIDQFTIWDSELNLVDLNEAALKYPLISHSDKVNKKDFIGKNIVELEPHVKERGRYDQYLTVIKTGESLLIDDIIPSHEVGDIHLSVRAFKVGNGLGMITTDVTESKKAERALRESEQRYRLLADNVTDVISITDLNLQLVYISPSVERLLGYSVKEAMNATMEHFLTPASLDASMEALAEEIATRNQKQKGLFWTRTLELEMTCKDGSTVWTENIVSPLYDNNGKVIGIVGVTRDIRERKQVEVALRESEEKLRSFMDSATDFFTIWDSELNLIDLNLASLNYPSIRNQNGATKKDYIGRNILDLDPDIKERGRYDQYLEVIRTGEPLFLEDVVHRPNMGDVYLSVRAFKVGDGLGLLTMDITDRKRADDAIRQAEKLRALGEMAGGVAHDFNNILSVVLGRAQLALADVKDEKARRSIEIIEQTALDAAAMVRRLREVAVIKGERSFDQIDLNKLIEDAMQIVESRRLELEETAGVTIEMYSEQNEVAPAAGDAGELREALVNILFNAMDAMPEGGTITMACRQEDSAVVLSVSDTGTGIPEEVRRKVFDPFFSTKASKGSGLGLSVTMGIITKHGGSIDVESTQGEGTTFHIRLPIANCVANGSCTKSKPPIIKRARILLVDDDPEVSDIIGLTLEHLGHSVTVVTSGREALSAFKGDNYGLVITDLGMPDVSGIDVARAVKATKPDTPVMLITGWGVHLDTEQMREIDSVIEKPFGKDALIKQMAELLPAKNGVKARHR